MKNKVKDQQSIWLNSNDSKIIEIIDQRFLPHQLVIEQLKTWKDSEVAIREMHVRGAPLIGVTAAYGMYLACLEAKSHSNKDAFFLDVANALKASRPTAVNLAWAVDRQLELINVIKNSEEIISESLALANKISDEEIENCAKIGQHGLELLQPLIAEKKGKQCWLAGLRPIWYSNRSYVCSSSNRCSYPCLGRRNTPTKSRCPANSLGTNTSRYSAYGHSR